MGRGVGDRLQIFSDERRWLLRNASSALQACVASCADQGATAGATGNIPNAVSDRYLHIHRDPRDVAVSTCFWLHKEWSRVLRPKKFEKCVYTKTLLVTPWIKLRELWLGGMRRYRSVPVTTVCYEDLIGSVAEHQRVIRSVGIHATETDVRRVMDLTSAAVLSSRHDLDVHNNGGVEGAPKIRSAGARRYFDYTLSADAVDRLDSVVEVFSFSAFLPQGMAVGSWARNGG